MKRILCFLVFSVTLSAHAQGLVLEDDATVFAEPEAEISKNMVITKVDCENIDQDDGTENAQGYLEARPVAGGASIKYVMYSDFGPMGTLRHCDSLTQLLKSSSPVTIAHGPYFPFIKEDMVVLVKEETSRANPVTIELNKSEDEE